jgi:flagellar motor switch protein FliN/FliY
MLMDMELPLLVRFGSTKMLLRDLLKLSAGSVIEFGRAPENPVEVLVNGKVVARGTAVVVQGNYGVRISEIAGLPNGLEPGNSLTAEIAGEGKGV